MGLRRLMVIASLVVAHVGVLSGTPALACHDPHNKVEEAVCSAVATVERIIDETVVDDPVPDSCTVTFDPPSVSCT